VKRAIVVLCAPLLLSAADVDPQQYLAHVKYLASPELKGRATGSPELEKAADYIAAQFRSFGVKPLPGHDYKLPYGVSINARLGADNHMEFHDAGANGSLAVERDFVPMGFSSVGKLSGDVVFAGYGITAAPHYDDYAGIDVKGKIVLIFRHEPKEGKEPSTFSAFAFKAATAKAHGARGVILINDVWAHEKTPESESPLTKFTDVEGPKDSGVFFVQVKTATAEQWMKAEGRDLHEIWSKMERDQQPESFAMAKLKVDLTIQVLHDDKTVNDVAAYLPGQTNEYVIVGAHYDHLGMGDSHSLAPSEVGKAIHPGADDNASGTAGVIELARWFAKHPPGKRGILFLTFSGEELGLLGSSWYAEHPVLPLAEAVAMINMDMIGRTREGKVFLGGSATGSTFAQLLEAVQPPAPLKIDRNNSSLSDASDHTSFSVKQVPVLFLFSGLHGDYHKPSDTADKIDAADAAKIVDYVADLATKLATDADRPKYVRVAAPPQGSMGSSGSSGYGPAFGSIPDFNEPPHGVRFADVRDGTPAAKAGLKAGDILIEFDGKDIGNLYDFTNVLRAHKPGDLVLVKVLRGTQTIEAKVLLTERR
jgi:hypothetical protein